MPFDPLLLSADMGKGNMFAVVPHAGKPDVRVGRRERQPDLGSPGLGKYLEWWLDGSLFSQVSSAPRGDRATLGLNST